MLHIVRTKCSFPTHRWVRFIFEVAHSEGFEPYNFAFVVGVFLPFAGCVVGAKLHCKKNKTPQSTWKPKIILILRRISPLKGYASGKKERWPSGLRSAPGKCVYLKRVSRVRIPLSPQTEQDLLQGFDFYRSLFCFCRPSQTCLREVCRNKEEDSHKRVRQ